MPPRVLEVDSTCGRVSPETSTVCETSPGCRMTSARRSMETSTLMPLTTPSLEAGLFHGDAVSADGQLGNGVAAVVAGGDGADQAGVGILDGDGRAGDGQAGRIGDGAENRAAKRLGALGDSQRAQDEESPATRRNGAHYGRLRKDPVIKVSSVCLRLCSSRARTPGNMRASLEEVPSLSVSISTSTLTAAQQGRQASKEMWLPESFIQTA